MLIRNIFNHRIQHSAILSMALLAGNAQAGDWSLGVGGAAGRSPLKGVGDVAGAFPVVGYRSERFHFNLGNPGTSFFDGDSNFGGLSYSLFRDENYNLDIIGQARLMGFEADDSDDLRGMDERKPAFDAGIGGRLDTGMGELGFKVLADVSGRHHGQEVILSYALPMTPGNWTLRPSVGLSWQSKGLVDYYYGVRPHEAIAGRASYEGKSTVNPFAGIEAEYRFTENTHFIGGAGVSYLGDGAADSPIVSDRTTYGGYLGVVYRF